MKTKIEFIINLIISSTSIIAFSILVYGVYILINDMFNRG